MTLETWEFQKEFEKVAAMFNRLTPAERNTFKGWKLQILGLVFAPPGLLPMVAPEAKSWLEWVVQDLSKNFEIRKSGTILDALIR